MELTLRKLFTDIKTELNETYENLLKKAIRSVNKIDTNFFYKKMVYKKVVFDCSEVKKVQYFTFES